jgi:hypothetical protein
MPMPASAPTSSPNALDAEANLRGAQAAAAAFAELLEFRRVGGRGAPTFPTEPLAHVAALSRELAGAVDMALEPTGLAPVARARVDVAVERVRVSAAPPKSRPSTTEP